MRITSEPIKAGDLQPGDLFTTAELPENPTGGGILSMILRTDGDLPMAADAQVFRLAVERRRWTHGLRSTYVSGCRCGPCTAAQRVYMRNYKRERTPDATPTQSA